jgi:hypothetical protein
MVFLPEIEPRSFLLFVHSPSGSTNLRNYASGREQVLGAPLVDVFRSTEVGKTRHECEEHKTGDHSFWYQRTQEFNRRYLSLAGGESSPPAFDALHTGSNRLSSIRDIQGRARRGSQRQLQDYVNDRPDELSQAILDQLPARVREWRAKIRWVSPLARDAYREYRDADFLRAVGLGDYVKELAEFWPSMGPSWDALGLISDSSGRMKKPGVILVEAKSHIPEIYGSGCQASPESLVRIQAAIDHTRAWCGVSTGKNWLGPLYQSANRIAHLYWLYERIRTPVWLVNLYFTGDPIGPAGRPEWEREVTMVKAQLGLKRPVSNLIEVYLPALGDRETPDLDRLSEQPELEDAPSSPPAVADPFGLWGRRWLDLARFTGGHLAEPGQRIKEVLELWDTSIPGAWERSIDDQLLGARYRRGDIASPRAGEHSIEHEILSQIETIRCLDGSLVDGINAMPLTRDETGGRRGNVEGDLFLLMVKDGNYHLVICEVKHFANDCWYAAVESLRQLRLLHSSEAARRLFHNRNSRLYLPAKIPIIGLVVAPEQYYTQSGRKANVLSATTGLLREFRDKTGIEMHLAVWDAKKKVIKKLSQAGEI